MKHPFVWAELRTDDLPKAKKFYGDLFGWKLEEMPMGGDAVYVMVKDTGAAKEFGAGMLENPGKGHAPSHWTPFIAVDDVAAYSEKAVELGGNLVQKPAETPWGIISTILDPSGASFSLWQPSPKK